MTEAAPDPGRLEDLLGHRFRDRRLLEAALTHASHPDGHNERLEFLGDAVLSLVAAEELYHRFPSEREGHLTELKSRVVSRRSLERRAARMGLEPFLRTGASLGARPSLPRSVLGNALEALIGAIYLDAGSAEGLAATRRLIRSWMDQAIVAAQRVAGVTAAKQDLQVYSQKVLGTLPSYRVVDHFEHPHTAAFKVEVELAGRTFLGAWGTTKKQAEAWAAWEALHALDREGALESEPQAE